jgi:hypothetical protein
VTWSAFPSEIFPAGIKVVALGPNCPKNVDPKYMATSGAVGYQTARQQNPLLEVHVDQWRLTNDSRGTKVTRQRHGGIQCRRRIDSTTSFVSR